MSCGQKNALYETEPPYPLPPEMLYVISLPAFYEKVRGGAIVSVVQEEKKRYYKKKKSYGWLFDVRNLVPIVSCKDPLKRFGSFANLDVRTMASVGKGSLNSPTAYWTQWQTEHLITLFYLLGGKFQAERYNDPLTLRNWCKESHAETARH